MVFCKITHENLVLPMLHSFPLSKYTMYMKMNIFYITAQIK